jgi:DNA-binding phage protein
MALTKSFKDRIQTRAENDPAFRYGLLTESIESMLSGDIETGKLLLRDYVNATIGFEALAELTGKSAKSLMRMVSTSGNPTAKNLFSIISLLQREEGLQLQIKTA